MFNWMGARGGVVVKALRYKPAGRGFDTDGVLGIFQWRNPPGCTMALGSTQTLAEMSTRCISWGKGGRYVRMTTLPPSCAVVMKSGNLNFLEPSGPLQACNGTALPFFIYLRRKGPRYYSDALLGASVAHSPKKLPSIVVRFTLNLRHLLTIY